MAGAARFSAHAFSAILYPSRLNHVARRGERPGVDRRGSLLLPVDARQTLGDRVPTPADPATLYSASCTRTIL
jgi:hypothetical protein